MTGRSSAFYASRHPCWLPDGGYFCDCGHSTATVQDHNEHVASAHRADRAYCATVLDKRAFWHLFGRPGLSVRPRRQRKRAVPCALCGAWTRDLGSVCPICRRAAEAGRPSVISANQEAATK